MFSSSVTKIFGNQCLLFGILVENFLIYVFTIYFLIISPFYINNWDLENSIYRHSCDELETRFDLIGSSPVKCDHSKLSQLHFEWNFIKVNVQANGTRNVKFWKKFDENYCLNKWHKKIHVAETNYLGVVTRFCKVNYLVSLNCLNINRHEISFRI